MPPNHNRSTSALRIALITSKGVAASLSKPIAFAASGVNVIVFNDREKTPPPFDILLLS